MCCISISKNILHKILPTNNFLFRIGYKDSSKCTFGYIHEETIEHLLFYCRHVNKMWNNLQFLCQKYGLFTFNISVQNVIFGIEVNDNIYNKSTNYLLILTKYYIYTFKCRENTICSFVQFFH